MVTRILRPEEVPFDVKVAYRFLKVREDSDKFDRMRGLIMSLSEEHRSVLQARFRYRICGVQRITRDPPEVHLEGDGWFRGGGIARLLEHSPAAIPFLLTLGEEIDRSVARLAEQDPADAYFLDGVASALTEGVLAVLRRDLHAEGKNRGFSLGGRYAPGYARWPLEEQKPLVDFLRGRDLGIRVSETMYLTPLKSLSGIFSVRPIHTEGS